jgi:prepilin-type N-terminal cleavage/methylation domain-containing protein
MTLNMQNKQSGFTLVELAVVIVIAAILLAGAAAMTKPMLESSRLETTKIKEDKIAKVLGSFAQTYGRLPCPADANPGVEPFGSSRGSGPDGQNFATTTCGIDPKLFNGILPFKTLGLSEEQAKDSYGNFFTYAVNPAMTQFNPASPTFNNTIVQNACVGRGWGDGVTPKNIIKANVCCPQPSPIGALKVTDSTASTAPLFNPGPQRSNGYVGQTAPRNILLIPDPTTVFKPGSWSEFRACPKSFDSRSSNCYWDNGPFPYDGNSYSPDYVMTGRWHSGDERGQTQHEYAKLKAVYEDTGEDVPNQAGKIKITDITYSNSFTGYIFFENEQTGSSGQYKLNGAHTIPANATNNLYPNPANYIIIGREHQEDEQGRTRYILAHVTYDGKQAITKNQSLLGRLDESGTNNLNLSPSLPSGWISSIASKTVLTQRVHISIAHNNPNSTGDENTPTDYYSAQLEASVDVPVPPSPMDRTIAFVLVSHGKDGDGAWMKNAGRKPPTVTPNAQESVNYNGDLNFVDNVYSTAGNDHYFDDVVLWKTNDQLISQFGNDNCMRP